MICTGDPAGSRPPSMSSSIRCGRSFHRIHGSSLAVTSVRDNCSAIAFNCWSGPTFRFASRSRASSRGRFDERSGGSRAATATTNRSRACSSVVIRCCGGPSRCIASAAASCRKTARLGRTCDCGASATLTNGLRRCDLNRHDLIASRGSAKRRRGSGHGTAPHPPAGCQRAALAQSCIRRLASSIVNAADPSQAR